MKMKDILSKDKKKLNESAVKKSNMGNSIWTEFGARDYKFGVYVDLSQVFSDAVNFYVKSPGPNGTVATNLKLMKKWPAPEADKAEKELNKIQDQCEKELRERLYTLATEFESKVQTELLKVFSKYNK